MNIAIARTHPGLVRHQNEDRYVMLPKYGFAAVADGMGGHWGGEMASAIAVDVMARQISGCPKPDLPSLLVAMELANKTIYQAAQQDQVRHGMGTTLTGVWLSGDDVLIGHVGDSRAYVLRDGALHPMTQDHSLVAYLVESGDITPEEAQHHPQRNVIMRALGTNLHEHMDVRRFDRKQDDLYLLTSDGLTNLVSDQELEETLLAGASWEDKADKLLDMALSRGGYDNITFVLYGQGGGAV